MALQNFLEGVSRAFSPPSSLDYCVDYDPCIDRAENTTTSKARICKVPQGAPAFVFRRIPVELSFSEQQELWAETYDTAKVPPEHTLLRD